MPSVRRALCAAVLVGAALAGCDYNSVDPDPEQTAEDGLSDAQRRLAELASLAASASYDASYDLRAASGDSGTIRIVASPPDYRVDVTVRGGAPSSFIQRAGEVVSCTTRPGRASCFLVARAGERVPELFDPGVQRLFSDAVRDLAANPEGYVVTVAPTPTPSPRESGTCFDVRRVAVDPSATPSSPVASPRADPTGFETGSYCFAADGVLTRVAVTTGTLDLRSRGPAPGPDDFVPPASPAALPDLPSASPSG